MAVLQSSLPTINACLNATSAVFLVAGWIAIKNKRVDIHRACMGAALLCSTVFLACYLYYHFLVGSVRFEGEGLIRNVYFFILVTHVILAIAILPMVLRTVFLAIKERFEEHRWWARRTLPLWLYVSVTGVVVYWMLYRL